MSAQAKENPHILYYGEGPCAPDILSAHERALRTVTNGATYSIEQAIGNPERTFLEGNLGQYGAIIVQASSTNLGDVVTVLQLAREARGFIGRVVFVYSGAMPSELQELPDATRVKTNAGKHLDRDAASEIARTLGLISREGRA